MIGRTNAAARAGFVKGGDVLVSHSAGASGMIDHGVVTMEDGDFRLLEVKQSGTLTFDDDQLEKGIPADICLVSGGGGGQRGGCGGAGGHLYNYYSMGLFANINALVGAGGAGGTSSLASGGVGGRSSFTFSGSGNAFQTPIHNAHELFASIFDYGSGGGAAGGAADNAGAGRTGGDGLPKYPFANATFFNIHCGGAGGGYGCPNSSSGNYNGGTGGTNGGDGAGGSGAGATGGAAGDSSAGAGGTSGHPAGYAASYYGGGGGGGAYPYSTISEQWTYYDGGAGYQGVIWIRIPA